MIDWDCTKKIRNIIHTLLASSGPEDIIYYRAFGSMMLLYYPLTFFWPFHRCKIISEHNTIEVRELLLDGEYTAAIRNFILGNLIIGQSDGIIGVTEEITRYWIKRLFYRYYPGLNDPERHHGGFGHAPEDPFV